MNQIKRKTDWHRTYGFLAVLLLGLLLNGFPVGAETLEGRVVGVHDGDTVTLLTTEKRQFKIRLAQIDAPESRQAFGQRSKQSLSDLVFNKTIRVEKETTDKYGRLVGTLYVDGLDVNREQVHRGMAWAYRQYLHDPSLIEVEAEARKARTGLWADANPMPPWEYRHGGAAKRQGPSVESESHSTRPIAAVTQAREAPLNGSCGSKRYCKEMTSCEEATFYLNQCGLSRLDADHDGVPCESLCRR